jgi:hypothetical protein
MQTKSLGNTNTAGLSRFFRPEKWTAISEPALLRTSLKTHCGIAFKKVLAGAKAREESMAGYQQELRF